MSLLKYRMHGNDFVGVYATANDKFAMVGPGMPHNARSVLKDALGVECFEVSIANSELVGIFSRGNSSGMLVSNMAEDREIKHIKKMVPDFTVERLESSLNTVGNNILANDKVAFINPEYSKEEEKSIADVLGVEIIRAEIGEFKTVGANNILTNKGFIINNRSTDSEKAFVDRSCGFQSVRTSANTGSLNIGLSAVTNSNGILVGESTTGFELTRIAEGLNLA